MKVKMKRAARVLCILAGGGIAGMIAVGRLGKKTAKEQQHAIRAQQVALQMMARWIKLKQDGRQLAEYFERENYRSIAIYGMGRLGECLLRELEKSSITVRYAIDRQAENICADIDVVTMDDELEDVDVIVVTPVHSFDFELSKKTDCPILCLEDVIFDL